MRGLIIAAALSILGIMPASAGVRDAVLGIEGKSALSLVRFDAQPGKAIVRSGPDGVEVLVSGVNANTAKITPPDPHLINAIDISPVEGGVRLLYHFIDTPEGGNVEVYKNAVLVRVRFNHELQMQTAGLDFGSVVTPIKTAKVSASSVASADPTRISAKTDAPKEASSSHGKRASVGDNAEAAQEKTTATDKASEHNAKTAHNETDTHTDSSSKPDNTEHHNTSPTHDTNAPPLRDGDVMNPSSPRREGTGRIREASASRTSQSLDAQSCAAAQKAIEDDPWALDKLSLYGACIAKEGRKDEAKEVFERLLTFDPDMISAYMGLGAIAQESGDIAAARRNYQQALGLGGSDAQAAQIRSLLGSLKEAH